MSVYKSAEESAVPFTEKMSCFVCQIGRKSGLAQEMQ